MARRYHADEALPRSSAANAPAAGCWCWRGSGTDLPIVLSECGGIAFSTRPGDWGYARAERTGEFAEKYARLDCSRSIGLLSGFCYTQFADTYQETNGLLDAARHPKIPLERIAAATRGLRPSADAQVPSAVSDLITPSPYPTERALSKFDVD